MAGKVLNIKVCSPLKLPSGFTDKNYAICHYSYNFYLQEKERDSKIDKNQTN